MAAIVKESPVANYGEIATSVREALSVLADADKMRLSATDIHRKIVALGKAKVEVEQVRTALKVMAKRGEVSRVERGVYSPILEARSTPTNGASPQSPGSTLLMERDGIERH